MTIPAFLITYLVVGYVFTFLYILYIEDKNMSIIAKMLLILNGILIWPFFILHMLLMLHKNIVQTTIVDLDEVISGYINERAFIQGALEELRNSVLSKVEDIEDEDLKAKKYSEEWLKIGKYYDNLQKRLVYIERFIGSYNNKVK